MENKVRLVHLSLVVGMSFGLSLVGCGAVEPPSGDEVASVAEGATSTILVCDGRSTYRTRYLRPRQATPVKATSRAEAQLACAKLLVTNGQPQPNDPPVRCPGCPLGQNGCQVTDAMVRLADIELAGGVWYCAAANGRAATATITWRCGRCGPQSCNDNTQCDRSEYCEKGAANCGGQGVCTARPLGCNKNLAPVCGCDGNTYDNECLAATRGVSVAYQGQCKTQCCDPSLQPGTNGNPLCFEGASCCADGQWACNQGDGSSSCRLPGTVCQPPPCQSNADCDPKSFCRAAGCNVGGFCASRPRFCPLFFDPVCGCDGKTYGNTCEAASAGVNVAAKGACCALDTDCQAGQVCEPAVGCTKPSVCVPGCHIDKQCDVGQTCNIRLCLTCPCAGVCAPVPGCATDKDCPAGEVCELDTGCTKPMKCVPGCRTDAECSVGETCNQIFCLTCPCPGRCSAKLQLWNTCGDPVCGIWRPKNLPLCQGQMAGDPCRVPGPVCDPMDGCNTILVCQDTDPTANGCPISRAKYKQDIRYLDPKQLSGVRDELLGVKLATYRYTSEPVSSPRHLGFIIDDVGASPAVRPDGERVDLYGYTSMAVAAVQEQARQIEALAKEVKALRSEVAAKRRR